MGRTFISGAVLASIGSLFIFKYLGRTSHAALPAALIYFCLSLLIFTTTGALQETAGSAMQKSAALVLFSLVIVFCVGVVYMRPDHTAVGRLPAFREWLGKFLSGRFPYGKPANPSGFPVLFLIAIPFYYLGNIGLLEACGLAVFWLAAVRVRGWKMENSWHPLLVLTILPTTYYEVLTRSELFFNMSLVLALIVFSDSKLDEREIDLGFVITAIFFGLVLSTRTVVGLVYAVYVVFKFRSSIRNGLLFTLIVLATFCLTLLPFTIWNLHSFMMNGPFSMQFAHASVGLIVAALIAAVAAGLAAKSLPDVLYYSGLIVFGIVLAAFIGAVITTGAVQALILSRFDIGYFILCVPFLASAVGERGAARLSIESRMSTVAARLR